MLKLLAFYCIVTKLWISWLLIKDDYIWNQVRVQLHFLGMIIYLKEQYEYKEATKSWGDPWE